MSLADVILYLHPTAVPQRDFTVQDNSDGNGPFITQWQDALGKQPTPDELVTVEASPAFQEYLATREKIQQIDHAKAELGPRDLAIVRVTLKAAGLPVPDEATLKQQIAAEIDTGKAVMS